MGCTGMIYTGGGKVLNGEEVEDIQTYAQNWVTAKPAAAEYLFMELGKQLGMFTAPLAAA